MSINNETFERIYNNAMATQRFCCTLEGNHGEQLMGALLGLSFIAKFLKPDTTPETFSRIAADVLTLAEKLLSQMPDALDIIVEFQMAVGELQALQASAEEGKEDV